MSLNYRRNHSYYKMIIDNANINHIIVPIGTILVNNINLKSNLTLEGINKDKSIIMRNPNIDYSDKPAKYRLTSVLQAYNLEVGPFYNNIVIKI